MARGNCLYQFVRLEGIVGVFIGQKLAYLFIMAENRSQLLMSCAGKHFYSANIHLEFEPNFDFHRKYFFWIRFPFGQGIVSMSCFLPLYREAFAKFVATKAE